MYNIRRPQPSIEMNFDSPRRMMSNSRSDECCMHADTLHADTLHADRLLFLQFGLFVYFCRLCFETAPFVGCFFCVWGCCGCSGCCCWGDAAAVVAAVAAHAVVAAVAADAVDAAVAVDAAAAPDAVAAADVAVAAAAVDVTDAVAAAHAADAADAAAALAHTAVVANTQI